VFRQKVLGRESKNSTISRGKDYVALLKHIGAADNAYIYKMISYPMIILDFPISFAIDTVHLPIDLLARRDYKKRMADKLNNTENASDNVPKD
jgi:uncharacterized protein YceK